MWKKLTASVIVIGFFSGCVYTDSALQYAKEGTNRVQSGYHAKDELAIKYDETRGKIVEDKNVE